MNSTRSYLIKSLLIILVCATFTLVAFAQSTTDGAIAGVVTDQSKAVVVGAKVTVRNVGTNAQSSTTTDQSGHFRVLKLQPGSYEVAIESQNFTPYAQQNVIVEVGLVTNLDFMLAIKGSKETVEVTAEAPTVNTEQQDFNSNINQAAINNLPINGRRWSQYVLLTPGTTPDGNFGLISFRGISGLLNNNTVDGGDNNQAFFSEERGRTRSAYTVSQASIREFQVNTSNYSAEYGRAAGAVVNSVTKSGTNNLHGEAFYYIRDNALGATNPFTYNTVLVNGSYTQEKFKPEDRRQQFGGNLGGPIIKDKLFFFFNYDGQRRNFPGVGIPYSFSVFNPITTSERTTLARLLYDLSSSTTPTTAQLAAADTAFNNGQAFLAAEVGQVPRTGDQNVFFPKLDWVINSKNTLTASYNRMRWYSPAGVQTQPTVTYATNSFGNDGVKTDMINLRLSSTITNTLLNEFRYQWGRDFEFQSSQEPSAAEQALQLDTFNGRVPYVSITNGVNFGRPNFLERVAYPDETRNQFADSMSWVKGRHMIKFGFDMVRNNDLYNSLYQSGGQYSYSNRVNFFADLQRYEDVVNGVAGATASRNYSNFYQGFGPTQIEFHTWDYAGFIQDDIKLFPRLTINLGLRYEFEKMPQTQHPNPLVPETQNLPSDTNNFGPRFGFALDVFGDGKTAIRGGYGLYYGRINNGAIGNALFNTGYQAGLETQSSYSYCTTQSSTCDRGPTFPYVQPAPTALSTSKPSIAYFASNLQNPQIQQADLIFEQQVAKNTVLSFTYLLSLGRELPQFLDTNIAASTRNITYQIVGGPLDGGTYTTPFYDTRADAATCSMTDPTKPRCFNSKIRVQSSINSSYNALAVQLNRKMTSGLQILANYTWSHALDNGQNSYTQTASYANVYDPNNMRLEYGTSNFDIRHRFSGSVVWQPQYFKNKSSIVKAVFDNWGIAPVITVSTGRPYTEGVSGNAYFGGGSTSSTYGAAGGLNGAGGNYRMALSYGRNSWRYPNLCNIDMRLSRSFKLTERQKVEFIAEAFNLFNSEQISSLLTTMYKTGTTGTSPNLLPTLTYDPTFGNFNQAGATLYRERQVQFAIRYSF